MLKEEVAHYKPPPSEDLLDPMIAMIIALTNIMAERFRLRVALDPHLSTCAPRL